MSRIIGLLLWGAACLAPLAALAMPNEFAQEGLLLDANGLPLQGRHSVAVRFYNAANGGVASFTETHLNLDLVEGYYFISVGSLSPITAQTFRGEVYMSFAVDAGAEMAPRIRLRKVPGALLADVAIDAIGDVHPTTVTVNNRQVIDAQGRWVGDVAGLQGPSGAAGAAGPQGGAGPAGPAGPAGGVGQAGSPDTPAQVLAKVIQVDGAGSALDADVLDGFSSADFARTPAQVVSLLIQADGAGSSVDADTVDGFDSAAFPRTAQQVMVLVLSADGAGTGLDADRLDGLDSTSFLRDGAGVLAALAPADGVNSGLDADRLDGIDSAAFLRDGAGVLAALAPADGANSGLDADRLDGLDSTQLLRTDTNGVLAGNLQVNGALTVGGAINGLRAPVAGAAPGACDASRVGMIYFDSAVTSFFGCNGTVWVQFGAAGSLLAFPLILWNQVGGDIRQAAGLHQYIDVPGRSAVFNKASVDSIAKVTYSDNVGYHMTGHSWGCRWRIVVDGVVRERGFSSHTSTAPGWRINPHTFVWYLDGLGAGNHTYQIQGARGEGASECLFGWPDGDTNNFISVQEVARNRIAILRNMPDTRHTPAGWDTVPGRSLSYVKAQANTRLTVAIMDDFGYHMVGHGWGCRWRLLMDGGQVGRPASSHTSTAPGWRIEPRQLAWQMDGVAAGNHAFALQVYRPDGGSSSECLAGWPGDDTGNSFVVHEQDQGNVSIARNFSDTRLTPGGWTPLPGRELIHIKQNDSTKVRITYVDDLGYHMVGHSWGCRWRLVVDGAPVGKTVSSHTSTRSGWRINPHYLQWHVAAQATGAHIYRIEVLRPDGGGASECLAGWPDQDTNNYLMVEEIR